MFEFERFLVNLISPLPIIILIFGIGLILLLLNKKENLAKILLSLSFIFLIALTCFGITQKIVLSEEEDYKPNDELISNIENDVANSGKPLKWIVVLAGGINSDKDISLSSKLAPKTLVRLMDGILLHKKYPKSKLILSGGGPSKSEVKEADLMKKMCIKLGIPNKNIVIDRSSVETSQQVKKIKRIVKYEKFVLITSVPHIDRANKMLIKQGLKPILLTSDYIIDKEKAWYYYLPSSSGIKYAEETLYEFWAYLGAFIKGQI